MKKHFGKILFGLAGVAVLSLTSCSVYYTYDNYLDDAKKFVLELPKDTKDEVETDHYNWVERVHIYSVEDGEVRVEEKYKFLDGYSREEFFVPKKGTEEKTSGLMFDVKKQKDGEDKSSIYMITKYQMVEAGKKYKQIDKKQYTGTESEIKTEYLGIVADFLLNYFGSAKEILPNLKDDTAAEVSYFKYFNPNTAENTGILLTGIVEDDDHVYSARLSTTEALDVSNIINIFEKNYFFIKYFQKADKAGNIIEDFTFDAKKTVNWFNKDRIEAPDDVEKDVTGE